MSIEAARLVANVRTEGTATAGRALGAFHGTVGKTQAAVGTGLKVAAVAGAAGLGILAHQVGQGVRSLMEQQKVAAQTGAVIKSTGGAANITAAQVDELSNALEDKTTIDNKQIQSAANLMLTFTNVRNEAGKGNDVFNQSIGILTDMSAALGTDTSASAIQLGKALNDPIKGVSALSKVGVTFTQQQKDQIRTLVESGRTMEAQKIILAELNKEFGGSAVAAGNTFSGTLARVSDAVEGVQQGLARALMPALDTVARKANDFLRDPAVMKRIDAFGVKLAGLVTEETISRLVRWGGAGLSVVRRVADAGGAAVTALAPLGPVIRDAFGEFRKGFGPIDSSAGALGRVKDSLDGQSGLWAGVGRGVKRVADVIGGIDWAGAGAEARGLFTSISGTVGQFTKGGGADRAVGSMKSLLKDIDWKGIADEAREVAGGFGQIASAIPWDVVKTTMPIATDAMREALKLYDGMDPGLKAAVISAYAVNKVTGGAVADLVQQGIKGGVAAIAGGATFGGLLGRFTERGSSPANPMYVSGIGGAGGGAGGGGLSGLGALGGLLTGVGIAIPIANQTYNEGARQSARDGGMPWINDAADAFTNTPTLGALDFYRKLTTPGATAEAGANAARDYLGGWARVAGVGLPFELAVPRPPGPQATGGGFGRGDWDRGGRDSGWTATPVSSPRGAAFRAGEHAAFEVPRGGRSAGRDGGLIGGGARSPQRAPWEAQIVPSIRNLGGTITRTGMGQQRHLSRIEADGRVSGGRLATLARAGQATATGTGRVAASVKSGAATTSGAVTRMSQATTTRLTRVGELTRQTGTSVTGAVTRTGGTQANRLLRIGEDVRGSGRLTSAAVRTAGGSQVKSLSTLSGTVGRVGSTQSRHLSRIDEDVRGSGRMTVRSLGSVASATKGAASTTRSGLAGVRGTVAQTGATQASRLSAVRQAAAESASAIRNKKLSTTVQVNPVVNVSMDSRRIAAHVSRHWKSRNV